MNLFQRLFLLLLIPLLAAPLASAQKGMRPSSILQYSTQSPDDFIPGDGFMTAGELWNAIKPMNTATPNGVEDPLRDIGALHWITIGPDGSNWREPTQMWPGGYEITNSWRDGIRLMFPVFEADGWGYEAGNVLLTGDETEDQRYMFAYYSPDVLGADDPTRNYKQEATFTDASRTHLVYEAGWPTTAGIDFQLRAHQYTVNEQNLNDFLAVEITLTNTGMVDRDLDGEAEIMNHRIDAVSALAWGLPTIAVWVGNAGDRRANLFGAGRTFGYVATPDATGAPYNMTVWYANVPPDRSLNRSVPAPGRRLFGVNNVRFLEGYTDVWNAWTWLGVKEGGIDDGVTGLSPDKETLFGTHPIGEGPQRGWYTSQIWEPTLVGINNSRLTFLTSTAAWYEDYGKTTSGDNPPLLGPNPAFFSGGDVEDVTTFVVGDPSARPTGDYKYASEDLGPVAGIQQPVWEEAWNPNLAGIEGGSALTVDQLYDGAVGFNKEYTFGEELVSGVGPFALDVGESMTISFVLSTGFRFEGVWEATQAAAWAWEQNWDIADELPVPPAPDVQVVSTPDGTALVRWTDVADADAPMVDVDGYKIWRAAQYRRTEWLDRGFRLVDQYQQQHEVDEDVTPFLDEVNRFFDAEAEFTGETQGVYQPAGWGTYELIEKIPADQLSQFAAAEGPYDYVFEDRQAITGFTYWYYVSAYNEEEGGEQFQGPRGDIGAAHVESSNWVRNGRNGIGAELGVLSLNAPWEGTYPYANASPDFPALGTQAYKNIGAAFTVTPPVAPVDRVAELITVTPNPYKITGLNDVRTNPSSHNIDFLNLPADYTLSIIDVSGQIIFQTNVEGAVDGKFTWDMFSKDGVEVASGLYIYHVTYGNDQEAVGHFAILR